MIFGAIKSVTNLDPTGLSSKVVDTAEGVTNVAAGAAGMVVDAAMDPVGTTGAAVDAVGGVVGTGQRLAHGAVEGAHIVVNGARVRIETDGVADMIYDAIVPQIAQAVLRGEMPTQADFHQDAIAWVGGPIQGVYVAANSPSAHLIAAGESPTAEQLGHDMIAALTPVAMRRLGL